MSDVFHGPLECAAVIEEYRQLLLLNRQHARQQIDVDALALARAIAMQERGEDSDHQVQPRELIGNRRAEDERRVAAPAGQPHRAGERLDQIVLPRFFRIGSGAAVAG